MDDHRKNYRNGDAELNCQESVSARDALPEDELAHFLLSLIPQLDLSPFHKRYAHERRGRPRFDVTMMVTLLVYAYSVGVCSSRKKEPAAVDPTPEDKAQTNFTDPQANIMKQSNKGFDYSYRRSGGGG